MTKKATNVLNAYLFYTKIKNPALEYQKEAVKDNPHMNREFVVDALIPEASYKDLKKRFKTVKAIKNAREFDAKEFEETFKVAPPFEADTYIVVKFKKKAYYKDGNAGAKPRIVGQVNKTKDKLGNIITEDMDIGNGTKAKLQFKERSWDNQFGKGLALDLAALCIVELVEYIPQDTLEFDFDEEEEEDEFSTDSADFEDGSSDSDDTSEDNTTEEDDW